jgi:hypothetical protein
MPGLNNVSIEEYLLLGCGAVWLWFEPTFLRNVSSVCSHLLTCDLMLFACPEDGGDTFIRNVGSIQIHAVLHPRKRYFS